MTTSTPERPKELEGVPLRISRNRLRFMLGMLGFDRGLVGLKSFRITGKSIEVEVFALNDKGHRYLDLTTKDAAIHTIQIPIDEDGF